MLEFVPTRSATRSWRGDVAGNATEAKRQLNSTKRQSNNTKVIKGQGKWLHKNPEFAATEMT